MATKTVRVADAMASAAYDILLECTELHTELDRDEYLAQYRKFYTALAEVAVGELERA